MPAPKKSAKAAAEALPAELDKPEAKVEGETPPAADDSAGDDGSAAADTDLDNVPPDDADDDPFADEEELEELVVPETGTVDIPCRVCFPEGWPAEEEGAYVNCAHDFGIRYGETAEITRERAVELGFLEAAN